MKTRLIVCGLLIIWTIGLCRAQAIGDKFPHFESVAAYDDRLLIIDFFTTTCSNCIASVPKLNALQKQFGESIQIVLVSSEPEQRVSSFFAKNKYTKDNVLPVIAGDSLLSGYFRHLTVPHVAWVFQARVVAITEGDFLTETYIQAILDGKPLPMTVKNDFPGFNPRESLIGELKAGTIYSMLQGFRMGGRATYGIDTLADQGLLRHYMINVPITGAYLYAYMEAHRSEAPLPYMKASRIIFEGVPPSRFIKPDDGSPMALWQQANYICYETVLPDSLSEGQRLNMIMADLNLKLGLSMRIEERNIPCLVVQADGGKQLQAYTETEWTRSKLSDQLFFFDINHPDGLPVINDALDIDQIWTKSYNNLNEFRTMLEANGLSIVEKLHLTPVLVISPSL